MNAPPPAELTPPQQTELLADLRALEVELEAQLEAGREGARPVTLDQQAIGRVSRIDAIQQQQMASEGLRRTRRRLDQVRRALRRAEDGDDYGLCSRCEEPIGFPRLKARPETPTCLGCQSALERRN
ncbi:MAG: TraR/DksA C4-type zinc finger protein [Myxococcales bacterium]|nr:TraR/DksA C4-type zinc finger protein [Myxococcales bacterium]MCB9538119.1 TraR/DksA C4-type zinc finger protein [Myxococcales bacterium]